MSAMLLLVADKLVKLEFAISVSVKVVAVEAIMLKALSRASTAARKFASGICVSVMVVWAVPTSTQIPNISIIMLKHREKNFHKTSFFDSPVNGLEYNFQALRNTHFNHQLGFPLNIVSEAS